MMILSLFVHFSVIGKPMKLGFSFMLIIFSRKSNPLFGRLGRFSLNGLMPV